MPRPTAVLTQLASARPAQGRRGPPPRVLLISARIGRRPVMPADHARGRTDHPDRARCRRPRWRPGSRSIGRIRRPWNRACLARPRRSVTGRLPPGASSTAWTPLTMARIRCMPGTGRAATIAVWSRLIFSERHLRIVMAQYARHYNERRPHRALQLRPPRPDHPVADLSQERVKRRSVLGGLLNEYERAA